MQGDHLINCRLTKILEPTIKFLLDRCYNNRRYHILYVKSFSRIFVKTAEIFSATRKVKGTIQFRACPDWKFRVEWEGEKRRGEDRLWQAC